VSDLIEDLSAHLLPFSLAGTKQKIQGQQNGDIESITFVNGFFYAWIHLILLFADHSNIIRP
jgi:hypothetical protein